MGAWEKYFLPGIVSRGKNYYYENRIELLDQEDGMIHTRVRGGKEYEVWIDPMAELGNYGCCTCPYYQLHEENCKHIAAVLFAMDEGAIIYEDIPAVRVGAIERKPYDLPWAESLDQLSAESMRKELMRLADQNKALQEELVLLSEDAVPPALMEDWRAQLYEISDEYADRRGYIRRNEEEEFSREWAEFLDRKIARLLRYNKDADAFPLLKAAGQAFMRRPLYTPNGIELYFAAEHCLEWIKELRNSVSKSLWKEMKHWHHSFFALPKLNSSFVSYEIAFIDPARPELPFYRRAGSEEEWAVVPKEQDDRFYSDPIERQPGFDQLRKIVSRRAVGRALNYRLGFGGCHFIWRNMKEIFCEDYGISWHSVAEMNPLVCFD